MGVASLPSIPQPKDTVQILLEAAIHCFARKGFDGTSIREVAAQAGKQISLIGYHFGDKEGLYLRCFQHLFEVFPGTPLAPGHSDPAAIRDSPRLAAQALRAVIGSIMQDLFAGEGNPLKEASICLFVREMRSPRPSLQALYIDRVSARVRVIRACIASLQPDLPDTEISFIGQSIFGQCLVQRLASGLNALIWQPLPAPEPPAVLADRIASFALKGLGYGGEP